MAGEGVTDGRVLVVIPDGEIIGGTTNAGWALNVGNISAYDAITLDVQGEVQGKGGGNGVDGSHAIYSVYPITINVSATGAIRAGGGGGGNGGSGGYGNDVGSWNYQVYNDGSDPGCDYLWVGGGLDSCTGGSIHYHRWCDTQICAEGGYSYRLYGSYVYKAGAHKWSAFYDIQRAYLYGGSAGGGGSGGDGQGYQQTQTNGSSGGSGSQRAGNGGTGGDGGDWGTAGTNGAKGGTGYQYTRSSSSSANSGANGQSGGIGGRAIWTLNGPATGVIVNNSGTIQGSTYY